MWVSNAFRLLGSGEPSYSKIVSDLTRLVSNAFRLLGSGEPRPRSNDRASVSNAFRLLGSGERQGSRQGQVSQGRSQMPFGFWVLGNPSL